MTHSVRRNGNGFWSRGAADDGSQGRVFEPLAAETVIALLDQLDFEFSGAAQHVDADVALDLTERAVDGRVADLKVEDSQFAQLFGKLGQVEAQALVDSVDAQAQAGLQQQKDRSRGPGLRRTGNRVQGRAFAVAPL